MKRYEWYVGFLLLFFCAGVCAQMFPVSDFWRNPTGKDISWAEIARRMEVTENQAKAWGPVNRPRGLRSGEWTAKHDLGIGPWFAWYYHANNAVEEGLQLQVESLDSNTANIVRGLLAGPKPEAGKLIWGQRLSWITFQRQRGQKPERHENVICLWQNMDKAGRPIPELPTFEWLGTGIGYVLDCYNLYQLAILPTLSPTPTPEKTPIPPLPPDLPTGKFIPPTPLTNIPPAQSEETPHPFWGKGVIWAIGEYVDADTVSQINSYNGIEWRYHLLSELDWTVRGEAGFGCNFDGDIPETNSRTFMLRTGLRYKLIYQAPFELDIEAGPTVWFHNEDFAVFKWNDGPSYELGSAQEASSGGYVRILAKGRYETYFEGEYRELGKERGYGAAFSAEPKRLYFDVGLSGNESDELSKDAVVYRSDSTFTEWHAKAGYKFLVKQYPLIVAVTYQAWTYESDSWEICWEGPGLFLESRPDPKGRWRFKAHVWSFERTDGPPDEQKTRTDEFRAQVGLTYSW